MNKRVLLSGVVIGAILLTIIMALYIKPNNEQELEWLHTEGRYIKDESGEIIFLRGVAVIELLSDSPFGVSKNWGQAETPSDFAYGYVPNSFDLLENVGVNCIRLSINWYAWMGLEHPINNIDSAQAADYRKMVDTFIHELNNRGIYVFIDFHTFGGWESPEKWQEFVDNYLNLYWTFWQEVADRYMKNPGVIGFELINEPRSYYNEYPYEGYWWEFTLETARKIHEINPKLLIFIASTDNVLNGTRIGFPADAGYKIIGDQFIDDPLPEPNIVYVFHHHFPMQAPKWNVFNSYVSENLSLAKEQYEEYLNRIAFRATNYELPIMNSEFNVKHYDYRTFKELPYPYLNVTRDLFELMNEYGCHWIWWSWKGSVGYPWDFSSETNELVYAGNPESPMWDTLSEIGILWRIYLNK